MPQIANQDYNVIAPVLGETIQRDATALAKIVRAISHNTIYDCILKSPIVDVLGDYRPVGVEPYQALFRIIFVSVNSIQSITVGYPAETYDVLGKLQEQIPGNQYPVFYTDDGHLTCQNAEEDVFYISVNGHLVTVEYDPDKEVITALSVDYDAPVGSSETLVLDENDLQYLIGVSLY